MDTSPKLILANIQGLHTRNRKDKTTRLAEMASEENVIIIAITESHLREEVLSAEVAIPGYALQRVDRGGGTKKGGVAIYLREDISQQFGSAHGGSFENIEFLCNYCPKWNLVLCIVYRPEGSAQFERVMREISAFIDRRGPPLPNIILMGDFNFPQITWSSGVINWAGRSSSERRAALRLLECNDQFCLAQVVDKPTRGKNLLDLILTNNCDLVGNCSVADSGLSDHRLVIGSLSLPSEVKSERSFSGCN